MPKNSGRMAYWRTNLRYTLAILSAWAFVSFGCSILLADRLDAYRIGGFPLGFWFANQGSLLVFVLLIALYALLMAALDQRHGADDD